MTDVKTMRRARAAQTDFIKTAGLNVLFFACGTLITRGAVLGDMAPFGSSYAASVPKRRLIPSLLGTALGYILLKPSDSFRYIAVIIAIGCAQSSSLRSARLSQRRLRA